MCDEVSLYPWWSIYIEYIYIYIIYQLQWPTIVWISNTPPKTNMEPKNDAKWRWVSFSMGWFSGSILVFGGANASTYANATANDWNGSTDPNKNKTPWSSGLVMGKGCPSPLRKKINETDGLKPVMFVWISLHDYIASWIWLYIYMLIIYIYIAIIVTWKILLNCHKPNKNCISADNLLATAYPFCINHPHVPRKKRSAKGAQRFFPYPICTNEQHVLTTKMVHPSELPTKP